MATLENSKPFRFLGAVELAMIRQAATERKFSAGQEIFREGDNGDGVYLLKEGLVEISVNLAPGTRRVFSQIQPGEVFGEMAVIELKPRSATATAVKESTAYFIPRPELLAAVERSPIFSLELLREISQRLREFNRRYIQEILQTERLAVIGRLARSIVHDLKNPLSIIGLTADVVCMENAPAEIRQKAQAGIRKQIERVSELIGEVLEFTQGAAESNFAPADFYAFVCELAQDLQPELELRHCQLEIGNVPAIELRIDRKRLRRVFYNLIHNATDVMPDGGKIAIRFAVEAKELVTEIEDSGPGIAPEMADKLFQVFATHGKEHGTGLGLSICKKIVEDHGGRIWARNEAGKGAVFAFALPMANTVESLKS